MTNPMKRIHDTETGEIIDREMTADELAEFNAIKAEQVEQAEAKAQAETDKAAAQAKLEALGLTADDLKALGL
jgi:hypothetical protein